MTKGPGELKARKLLEREVNSVPTGRGKKAEMVDWLVQQFIDPETQQPILVGEGIEVGEFDSKEEARNWARYYLPDAYQDAALGWGKEKTKGGKTIPPVIAEAKERDGKVYLWLKRVKE